MVNMRRVLDLKAMAAETALTAGDYLTARYRLPANDAAVIFELVAPLGQGDVGGIAYDVFVFVLTGQFSINDILFEKDCGCKISAGMAFRWTAAPNTCLFVMSAPATEQTEEEVVTINPQAQMSPSLPPPVEYLQGPVPVCQSAPAWRSCEGQFYGGIWASTPYSRKQIPYVHDEFMFLLEGCVTFVCDLGEKQTFRAGDAFLICRGASCSWDSLEDVKKIYVIFRPE
ncbi:DUF861 domain-containing protein [Acetobacter tropicalis]|uniref:(S)-ureidoglycine aminohydrolase cupin domain-containing protein n=2 Tax=Acetobacter tropicalis TaxID=104102 RepID=A0A094ZFU8_9PROT|nr:DUF861 domain-containing protein [Acetobacter tropicalis]KAA8391687.1 DUF861 domain-containing protein [Acetobacter tropicalis]KGB21476.1 protein of unknown function DUF861, cupin 3 [Acetobacter tropicalis]